VAQSSGPETLRRASFRRYWRWKSRRRRGRPRIEIELRALIRRISIENRLWGAPRIHGKLLKLGFEVAQSRVAKYVVKRRAPSQGWRTFLRNHAPDVAAKDLFVGRNASDQPNAPSSVSPEQARGRSISGHAPDTVDVDQVPSVPAKIEKGRELVGQTVHVSGRGPSDLRPTGAGRLTMRGRRSPSTNRSRQKADPVTGAGCSIAPQNHQARVPRKTVARHFCR
jgi:hypothetical protein